MVHEHQLHLPVPALVPPPHFGVRGAGMGCMVPARVPKIHGWMAGSVIRGWWRRSVHIGIRVRQQTLCVLCQTSPRRTWPGSHRAPAVALGFWRRLSHQSCTPASPCPGIIGTTSYARIPHRRPVRCAPPPSEDPETGRVPCHVTKWVMISVCRNRYGTDWPRTHLSEPRQVGRLEWIRPEPITSAGWQTSDSLGTKQVLFGLPVRPFQCVIETRA